VAILWMERMNTERLVPAVRILIETDPTSGPDVQTLWISRGRGQCHHDSVVRNRPKSTDLGNGVCRHLGGPALSKGAKPVKAWSRNLTGYSFILPNFLGFLLFTSIPVAPHCIGIFPWDILTPLNSLHWNFADLLRTRNSGISMEHVVSHELDPASWPSPWPWPWP